MNATPVGMTPDVDGIPINPDLLGRFEVVMDIVYQPLQTRLLREAEAQGCATIDGLQMLIHQGTAQFKLFTGRRPRRRSWPGRLTGLWGRSCRGGFQTRPYHWSLRIVGRALLAAYDDDGGQCPPYS